MDAQSLYQQLGRIIETAPEFPYGVPITREQLLWIGRAGALIKASGDTVSWVEFDLGSKKLNNYTHDSGVRDMFLALHKVLAAAELSAPASVRGSFIPAGNQFDAFASVTKIFQSAKVDIFVVDPYLDETVLTEFANGISSACPMRLLADEASVKRSMEPAAKRWHAQYGSQKPLQLILAPAKTLHDRGIFIDSDEAWLLTQSLKDFAKRAPGEIVRAHDTAKMKIEAYETVWKSAKTVV